MALKTYRNLIVFALLISGTAHANEAPEKRHSSKSTKAVIHYPTPKPTNSTQAQYNFEKGLLAIDKILAKNPIAAGQPLETVHELTYQLEASIQYWQAQTQGKPQSLAEITELLEEVHLASERQKEPEARESFAKLQRLYHTKNPKK